MGNLPIATNPPSNSRTCTSCPGQYVTVRGYAGDLSLLPDRSQARVVIGGTVKIGDEVKVLQKSLK